jgi:hypothetical protein
MMAFSSLYVLLYSTVHLVWTYKRIVHDGSLCSLSGFDQMYLCAWLLQLLRWLL